MEFFTNVFRSRSTMSTTRSRNAGRETLEVESVSVKGTLLLALFCFRFIVGVAIASFSIPLCKWQLEKTYRRDLICNCGLEHVGMTILTAVGLLMCVVDACITGVGIAGEIKRKISLLTVVMAYLLLLIFVTFVGLMIAFKIDDTNWIIALLVAIIFNGFTYYLAMKRKEDIFLSFSSNVLPETGESQTNEPRQDLQLQRPTNVCISAPSASVAATVACRPIISSPSPIPDDSVSVKQKSDFQSSH